MRRRLNAPAAFSPLVLLPLAFLAGCGGGGGTASTPPPAVTPTPSPTPTPAPVPAPSPTPTPAAAFDTTEYRRSDGPAFHNAVSAWQRGIAGQGVAIGIVDSGIDTANPEFAGRISPASADVAGSRGIQSDDNHGTQVALVAAAARDGSGVVGIAYQATILAMRADAPGTCGTSNTGLSTCSFPDPALAAGVDRAVQSGAKVINLSLGGGGAGSALRAAVSRAAAAGVVVVVSAGNDADNPASTSDPASPEPFAAALRQAGNGNVIIAGSVGASGTISAFSNRAGTEANWYLSALGERVCCIYENGQIRTTTRDGQQFVTLVSGTSFAAPQISGAVALLRQAFPNLTAQQTVDLLLRTARDAGAAGTDAIYGRGVLDIAAALAPQGQTTLAGTSVAVALGESTGSTSPAMGDAGQRATLGTVVLDGYGRAYQVRFGALRGVSPAPRLAPALATRTRQLAAGSDRLALAFSVDGRQRLLPATALRLRSDEADSARVLAARMIAQVSADTRLGFAFSESADGLAAAMRGDDRPAFLLAGSPLNDTGFARLDEMSFALRRQIGAWGLTVSADRGSVRDDAATFDRTRRERARFGTARRIGAQVDRSIGPVDVAIGMSWLAEDDTVLGARFNRALAPTGADSLFLDLDGAWLPAEDWRVGGSLRQAWTRPRGGGLLAKDSLLVAQGWSFDVTRRGVFAKGDNLGLRLAQPLRVVSGGLGFALPIDYDYVAMAARNTAAPQRVSLVPRGRELIGELAWRGALWAGEAATSLFYRHDPGHYADAPDDQGVALSWSGRF